jgi:hypothetical protein
MMQLTDGVTTLTLPDDLEWVDEFTWNPVVQDMGYSLTGALIVKVQSERMAGRAITLQSPPQQAAIQRSTLNTLKVWADTPGKVLSLTLRSVARNVVFRHQDGPLQAEALGHWSDISLSDATLYFITLRFMEI